MILTEVDFAEVEENNVYCENKLLELMIYLTEDDKINSLYKTDSQIRNLINKFIESNWRYFQKKTELYMAASQIIQNKEYKYIMDVEEFQNKIENIRFLIQMDHNYISHIKNIDFKDQKEVGRMLVLKFLFNRCK